MLEFEVNGQRLRLKGNLYVVAESIDYLKARFAFSADWDGAAKTAIFKTADRKGVYNVILDENGICTVPSEVIHAPRFYVSVFGGSRITANEVEVQCNVSGYAEGSAPDTPTPEIYEQILAEINKKVSKVDGMGLSENSYTTEEKTKLGGIADGAEVNVQSDWSQTNADADDYIKNKPTKLSEFKNDSGYATSADLSSLSSGLSQGITNVSNALSNHQSATVLPHADGSVTTAKLAAGAVTNEKIAKGVIPTSLPASDVYDWAKQPEKPKYTAAEVGAMPSNTVIPSYSVATQSADGLMSAADKKKLDGLSEGGSGSGTVSITPLSEFAELFNSSVDLSACDFDFPYSVGVEFGIKNDLGCDVDSLRYGGDPVWNFSQTITEGKSYVVSITTRPQSGADWNNGYIEVLREVSNSINERISSAEERITALENTVGTANDTLAALLSEGV